VVGCESWCTVLDGSVTFGTGVASGDSADIPIQIGVFTLERGPAGDPGVVELRLDAPASWWDAVPRPAELTLLVDSTGHAIALETLRERIVRVALEATGIIQVGVALPRGLPRLPGNGPGLQVRFRGANILRQVTATARDAGNPALMNGSCGMGGIGTWCEVDVEIDPYHAPAPWTGDDGFTSASGTTPSYPITITFARAITSFSITVHDPDYVGNAVVAKDINGTTVDSVAVAGDGMPFVPSSAPATVTGTGIRSIELIPAPADFVTYDGASFVTPRFNLSCTQATRGSVATCTATADPSGAALSVSSWRFSNTSGGLHVFVNLTSSNTTWGGTVALGGTVEVFGTVGGVPDTGSTGLTVLDRNWSTDTVLYQLLTPGAGNLPLVPSDLGELGNTGQDFNVTSSTAAAGTILGGPNDSLRYWLTPPVTAVSTVSINYPALSVSSIFYFMQPTSANWPACDQADVVPFIPVVEEHEGKALQSKSHAYWFRQKMNLLTLVHAERVAVRGDFDALQTTTYDTIYAPAILARRYARHRQQNPPLPEDDPLGLVGAPAYCLFSY
jgi:hypothetical protein